MDPNLFAAGVVDIFSGIFWVLTYVLIAWISIKHKTYGMPLIALGANIGWEIVYTFIYYGNDPLHDFIPGTQRIVGFVWLVFDLIIVYTYIKYGRKHFPKLVNPSLFIPNFLVVMIGGFLIQLLAYSYFHPLIKYPQAFMAFVQNFMMTILFLGMLFMRKSTEGQSMYIAIVKMLGTLLAAISSFLIDPVVGGADFDRLLLLPLIGLLTFVYDIVYCVLLHKQFKLEGKNPWEKFWKKNGYKKLEEDYKDLKVG